MLRDSRNFFESQVNPNDRSNVTDSRNRRGSVTAAAASMPAPGLVATFVSAKPVRTAEKAEKHEVAALSDEVLFDQALGGDREALGDLISRYEKSLFGLLVRLTNGDRHRADDLFQETFLHAMRAASTFNR